MTKMPDYRARYYDSQSGRFLSEDPLRSPVRTKPYKCVSNNPLMFTDPPGLTETCTLSGVHQLTPWITYKREMIPGSWILVNAFETGGPDDESMMPAAILDCQWQTMITTTWTRGALFELTWQCTDPAPCGVTGGRIKYDHEWRTQQWTTSKQDNQMKSYFPIMGADSEAYDWFYCQLYGAP